MKYRHLSWYRMYDQLCIVSFYRRKGKFIQQPQVNFVNKISQSAKHDYKTKAIETERWRENVVVTLFIDDNYVQSSGIRQIFIGYKPFNAPNLTK